ncbi:MAG TPA: RHS repeat-associated core domain-containing protein [Fimbriimonadaceae bacterium]|nr:RHS repeat-associated core domain-containing protein [Fimbriimonadaceae bacterium]
MSAATTYAGTTATFDAENRLLTYGSATYTYRADGLRASDGTGSSKKYYLYDGGNAICRLDSTGTLDRTYVFAPDGLVGWSIPNSTSHQLLFDWQGNLEHSTGTTGSVATSHAYNAWGQRNSVFPINGDTGANDRFGYNARWGYVRDTTGLYYCQNRYYDPANGGWLNRDPIGYSGGMNLYGYCGGGPVGAADPSGLSRITWLYDLIERVTKRKLKTGITYTPSKRYTKTFLDEVNADLVKRKEFKDRGEARTYERTDIESAGDGELPLNNEPWSPNGRAKKKAKEALKNGGTAVVFIGCLKFTVETLDPTPIGLGKGVSDLMIAIVDPWAKANHSMGWKRSGMRAGYSDYINEVMGGE